MEKLRNEEVESQLGYFDRLPKEVVLSILSRMDDLKLLCRCSLVSKRFALMIYCIRAVSVSLPSIGMDSLEAHTYTRMLFKLGCSGEEIPEFVKFLHNFRELESIYVEFSCLRSPCISPFLKWKAICTSPGPVIQSVLCLVPSSMRKKSEHEEQEDEEEEETIACNLQSWLKDCSFLPLKCCREWPVILCLIIKYHNSLQNVTITDSCKHGKFVMRNEQLVEWRNSSLSKEFSTEMFPKTFRLSFVPELHLPMSGYLMKRVLFMSMDFLGESDPGAEYDAMTWDYDDEEKVVGESVREILTEHRDRKSWIMSLS
ncbi:hypothetical protein ACJIZ3_017483 [Penstemon smallii]|uniref:F-box domain-containing protein n=1 Tax=Penstemon smallii TaxID=265156 RepID=A0ABD3SVN1_9LAMI